MAREAVVVESLRTGLPKAHRGSFNMTEPVDYLAHTLRAVVERVPNLDAAEIRDVIVGCGFPEGCQGMNMARIAAMAAGFPKDVAATTVCRDPGDEDRTGPHDRHEVELDRPPPLLLGRGQQRECPFGW